jgi:DNA mismatch repair ATPase MutL
MFCRSNDGLDVRFKNNGLDSIEVQDNGDGIAPDDYETIGRHAPLPHERRN